MNNKISYIFHRWRDSIEPTAVTAYQNLSRVPNGQDLLLEAMARSEMLLQTAQGEVLRKPDLSVINGLAEQIIYQWAVQNLPAETAIGLALMPKELDAEIKLMPSVMPIPVLHILNDWDRMHPGILESYWDAGTYKYRFRPAAKAPGE